MKKAGTYCTCFFHSSDFLKDRKREETMDSQEHTWWDTQTHKKRGFHVHGSFYIFTFFLVIVLLASIMASLIPDSSQPRRGPEQSLEYPVPVEDVLNGCGGIFHFSPIERNYGVIPESVSVSEEDGIPLIPTRIQSYGYMSANEWTGEEPRFFDEESEAYPTLPKLLRGMWQGYSIMWYDAEKISPTDLRQMKTLTQENSRVIVVPWMFDQSMPMDRNFSYATWNISQSCAEWDTNVARAFTEISDPIARDKENPPEAPLNEHGELFDIPRFGFVNIEKPEEVPPTLQKDSYFYEN